ncbi:hypothetical protein Fcan01_18309 [Folsomia candida]|uniref:Uncharacterized protein n=2 Tax=Folsomia candida TaxID=158441 RepID=A0A226DPS0_FOLCA|nr:hypothetical protein Fcan01_18309 [Folsomia candida]
MASCSPIGEKSAEKRGHEKLNDSITDKFFYEICKQEGISSRQFFQTETDSSVQKKTGSEHIIYYKPFLNYDLVIRNIPMHGCNGVFEIRIKPVDWARAFNQLDFLPTIKFLYVALLTDQCRRVIDADLTARRNMLEILRRAAAWMIGAKEIDDILKKLNPVEHLRHVVEQERRQESTDFSVNLNYWDFEFSELARLEETEKEDTKFEELYKKCVDYVGRSPDVKLNTAQIAASLTKSTIQSNTDQFVDAVQFSDLRWRKAFKQGKHSIENSVDDIDPPKLTAIYRGSKFLYERRSLRDGDKEEFDSRIVSHNVFPTRDECIRINNEVLIYGTANVLKRVELIDQQATGSVDIAGGGNSNQIPPDLNLNLETILSDLVLPPLGQGSSDVGTFANATTAASSQDVAEMATTSSNHIQMDIGEQPFDQGQGTTNTIKILGFIPNTGINASDEHVFSTNASQIIHFGNFNNFSVEDKPYDRVYLEALKLNKTLRGIEPKLLLTGCTETIMVFLTVGIEKKQSDGTLVVETRSHAYSKTTWVKADEIYRAAGPISLGTNFLLKQLFKKDELKNFTPSGRLPKKKSGDQQDATGSEATGTELRESGLLDQGRQEQLFDTIRYLIWEIGLLQAEMYNLVEKTLKTDIFNVGSKVVRES